MEREKMPPRFIRHLRATRTQAEAGPAPRDPRGTWALGLSIVATTVSVLGFGATYYETRIQREAQTAEAFNDVLEHLGLNAAGETTFEPGVNVPIEDEKLREARKAIDRFEILSGDEEAADFLNYAWLMAAGDFEAARKTDMAERIVSGVEAIEGFEGFGSMFSSPEDWGAATLITLERASTADPSNVDLALMYGMRLHSANQNDRAISVLERAFALEPENANAALILGHVLMESDRTEDAERILLDAITGGYVTAETFNTLGVLYAFLGRHEEAVARYRQAISANSRTRHFYVNLSLSLTELGRIEEAEAATKQAARFPAPSGGPEGGSSLRVIVTE